MEDLTEIPYNQGLKLVSFDIKNMYPNIPTEELIKIIKEMCIQQALDGKTTHELLKITQTILEQNYFEFQNKCYIQRKGMAMGAPTSAVLSEIYLQNLECNKITKILTDNNILGYFRYVDDILIVYNENHTDIHEVHTSFNNLAPTVRFTIEKETDNKINFLDITISKGENNFSCNIFRKPTATDVIIPNDSCHPPEQKQAAIRFLLNRMNTYHLEENNKRMELNIIRQIITNNGYDTPIIVQLSKPTTKTTPNNNKSTWAKFTYIGKQTKFITKLFKETSVKIAYTTNNTISKYLSRKPHTSQPTNQYERSGIYQLTCPNCHKRYIGQIGRSFQKRYQEHFQDFKYNKHKSKYATHLLENHHAMESIDKTMQILYTTNKGRLMDTIEKFHIYKETHKNNQINDRDTVKYNAIFDTLVRHTSH
jgi:hypothetical protein